MKIDRLQTIGACIAGLFIAEVLGFLDIYAVEVQNLAWTGLVVTSGLAWVLYGGIRYVQTRYGYVLPEIYPLAFAVGILYLDAIGNVSGWYNTYASFDEVMHVLGGAGVASVALVVSWGSPYWNTGRVVRGLLRFSVVGFVAIAGIAFEGIEFAVDEVFQQQFWLGDSVDTLTDLLLNIVGAIVVLLLFQFPDTRRP